MSDLREYASDYLKSYSKYWWGWRSKKAFPYDPVVSLLMMHLSSIIYEKSESRRLELIRQLGFEDAVVYSWEKDYTEAMGVFLPEDRVMPAVRIIVFRGTQVTTNTSLEDIKSNLKTKLVPMYQESQAFVHEGYKESAEDLTDEIYKALIDFEGPIIYTGHSMGAGIATVNAWYMPTPDVVYSFGSPMVANKYFWVILKKLGVTVFRVVHGNDLARHWPWWPWVGLRDYWKYTKGVKPIRINQQRGIIPNIFDHDVSKYINALEYEIRKDENK